VIDDGLNWNAAVCAPWDAFRSVEMTGLFDRDQIQNSANTSPRLRLQIWHAALAWTDCQIKAEPIVFEAGLAAPV